MREIWQGVQIQERVSCNKRSQTFWTQLTLEQSPWWTQHLTNHFTGYTFDIALQGTRLRQA